MIDYIYDLCIVTEIQIQRIFQVFPMIYGLRKYMNISLQISCMKISKERSLFDLVNQIF